MTEEITRPSNKNIGHWTGGRHLTGDGYIMMYVGHEYPHNRSGYVLEHRYVMEKHLGRYLEPNEVVHHINKNIRDNTIGNLQLMNNKMHVKLEHTRHNGSTICVLCKKRSDYRRKTGVELWYKIIHGYICIYCYTKIRREKANLIR